MSDKLRSLAWIASSQKDLRAFPEDVKDVMGYALHLAQEGGKHNAAKPLKGYSGAGVLEIVDDYDGDTYRAVYTVKFGSAVYVLHAFQKKSKKGAGASQGGQEPHQRTAEGRRGGPSGDQDGRAMSGDQENGVQRGSGNVFADLGFADAANHRLKAELVKRISEIMRDRELTQTAASKLTDISQPDLSRLVRGHFRDVSVERLIKMLLRLDGQVDITVRHAGRSVGKAIHLEPPELVHS